MGPHTGENESATTYGTIGTRSGRSFFLRLATDDGMLFPRPHVPEQSLGTLWALQASPTSEPTRQIVFIPSHECIGEHAH